jgi:hypothetical protein
MFRRAATFTLTILFANAITLFAAERATPANSTTRLGGAIERAAEEAEPALSLLTLSQGPKRPVLLPALYGTYAVLQAMDVMSTKRALAAGAREGNPLMKSGGMGTTLAIKAASGAATFYFVEKAWKKNRVGAIVLMAAINGASAAIVARNSHNAGR